MINLRRNHERGATRLDWLHSLHSFSFGEYYDPEHLGVSALRVINDDRVQPGTGFAMHGHRDMEILTYVTKGAIQHRDTQGNEQTVPAGEFQLMSAGKGIAHSEHNPSQREPLELLQIWIRPDRKDLPPAYQQRRFEQQEGMQLVASADRRDGSLRLHQDAEVHRLRLAPGQEAQYRLEAGRSLYIHLVDGELSAAQCVLKSGDGATIRALREITLESAANSEALIFDLP